MKHLAHLFFLFLFGCDQATNKSNSTKSSADSSVVIKKEDANERWKEEIKKRRYLDNLNLELLLIEVLKIADRNKSRSFFKGRIDSSYFNSLNLNNHATYQYGNIFSKNKNHLLVKRFIDYSVQGTLYSDIYSLSNNQFKKVVSDTTDYYTEDTLVDINYDGYADYMVSSYSGSGCCPRDSRVGYLYNPRENQFVPVSFFNPEFNFIKKEFYESDYGHPGRIAIDKYKWIGFNKIKTESLHPTGADAIRLPSKPYSFTRIFYPSKKKEILETAPDEYKKLNIFEYFISYQD